MASLVMFRECSQQSRNGTLGPISRSTVPIGADEVAEHAKINALVHSLAGWVVEAYEDDVVIARRYFPDRVVIREIWYEAFDPATDGAAATERRTR